MELESAIRLALSETLGAVSCPHHSGPSRWRVTFKAGPGMFYTLDCWAPTHRGAVRNTRRFYRQAHPGLKARLIDVQELKRRPLTE